MDASALAAQKSRGHQPVKSLVLDDLTSTDGRLKIFCCHRIHRVASRAGGLALGTGLPMTVKAVVLGAAGFIGRHTCSRLARLGIEVHGVGHGRWTEDAWSKWGIVRWSDCSIDKESLDSAVGDDRPQLYVHCAGGSAVSESYASPLADFHRSVSTTAALLEHVRNQSGARARVVLTSSAAVYGDQGDVDLTETSTRSPVSPYGFNKLSAENLCDSYARFFGVDVSVVRLFSVYGEGLRKQLLWDALNKLSRGESEFFGTGNELRDWIHVEDAATLLCAAALAPQAHFDVFNGGHVKATTREVLSRLAAQFDISTQPRFTGTAHTGNPRRLTAECGHAHRQLGWRADIGLEQGLARYAKWFRNHAASGASGAP